MREVRRLSSFGILALVIWLLVLVGMSFTQAQVQMKGKPVTPPEATWAVQVPGASGMLSFDRDEKYENGKDGIEVTVEKNSVIGGNRRDNDFVTAIRFRIPSSSGRSVGFSGVSLSWVDPNVYENVEPALGFRCCAFPTHVGPNLCGSVDSPVSPSCANCSCMADFLNGAFHPYSGGATSSYRYFQIEILAFDQDLLTMKVDEPYHLGQEGHYNDYIVMTLGYQTADRPPVYHNIDCSKSAYRGIQSIHPFNIWITRAGENTWKVDVGRGIAQDRQFLFAEEYYYEPGRRRNLWHSTLFQGGYFDFTFDLIRTPPGS